MQGRHEVVVVGAGHNGLTVAAYLAQAGLDVCVVEALPYIGGGVVSAPIAPGFSADICSIWHGFIRANPLIVDDELRLQAQFGLHYIVPDSQFAVLLSDGSYLNFYRDVERTCRSIESISRRDAVAYAEFSRWAGRMFALLQRGMFNPPPPMAELASALSATEDGRSLRRAFSMSAIDVCNEWFESEALKVALAKFCAEANIAPQTAGSAVALLVFIPLTHAHGGGIPRGGSGALSVAMERCIRHYGGTIRTGRAVSRVVVVDDMARAVRLTDGEEIEATKAIVSNLHARQIVELVGAGTLPKEYQDGLAALRRSQYGAVSQAIALREAPRYTAGNDVTNALFVELATLPMSEFLASFDDYARGLPRSDMPAVSCQTRFDPTRAPEGQHTLHLFHYAPFEPRATIAGGWDAVRQQVADDIWGTLQLHAPNLQTEDVIARLIETPRDLARRNPAMVDGDYNHIGMYASQQMGNRYLPGWGYRTPIDRLWLCGPSCHPGGGVTGGGRAAVQPVLASIGIPFARALA